MTDWIFRACLLLALLVGASTVVGRSVVGRSDVDGRARRYAVYVGLVIAVAVVAPALVYDHARLARWLIG